MAERRFNLTTTGEADSLGTAFYRFLEVHSRALVGNQDVCRIKTVVENDGYVKIVTLWSEHAASDFVRFWDDYRRVYVRRTPAWRE